MKSRITIEVDFDNNNLPVLQIISQSSDDVRDKLLQSFLQSLQHTSRWCTIEYKGYGAPIKGSEEDYPSTQSHRWHIKPVTTLQIPKEMKLMEATIEKV